MKLNRDFIILSLNGHSESTRTLTRAWLDSVKWREQRVKLLLILIGKESCDDAWIRPYMKSNGGVIDKLFIVYDSNVVDEVDIYQWPLGPALYRGFVGVPSTVLNLEAQRPHVCSFLGTVYPGSSREKLAEVIKENNLEHVCYINIRDRYVSMSGHPLILIYLLSTFLCVAGPVMKNQTVCQSIVVLFFRVISLSVLLVKTQNATEYMKHVNWVQYQLSKITLLIQAVILHLTLFYSEM
jgi:hypothetical protein